MVPGLAVGWFHIVVPGATVGWLHLVVPVLCLSASVGAASLPGLFAGARHVALRAHTFFLLLIRWSWHLRGSWRHSGLQFEQSVYGILELVGCSISVFPQLFDAVTLRVVVDVDGLTFSAVFVGFGAVRD